MKISQGSGLWADVALAERVVFVTANVQTLAGLFVRGFAERILNSDFDATYRFAEIAGAVMKGAILGGSHGTVLQVPVASRSLEYHSSITRSFLLLFTAQTKCVNRPFLHANEKRIAGTTYTPDATLKI